MNKMISKNQPCHFCDSEAGATGCVCNGIVKLIGNKCLVNHIRNTDVDHNLVNLDLALRMQADPSLVKSYLKDLIEVQKAIIILRENSEEVEKHKTQLRDTKNTLLSHIEQIFNSIYNKSEEIIKEINSNMRWLNIYKSSLCEEGKLLMDKYKAQGSKALLNDSLSKHDIPINSILEYLTDTLDITQSTPRSSSNLLGIAQRNNTSKPLSANTKNYIQQLEDELSTRDNIIRELRDQLQQNNKQREDLIPSKEDLSNPLDKIEELKDSDYHLAQIEQYRRHISSIQQPSYLPDYINTFTLTEHTSYINSVCISIDCRWIISGSRDTTVRIWSVESKSQEAVLRGHDSAVNSVCMSVDSKWIISGSGDTTVRIWNMQTKSQESVLRGHDSAVTSVGISVNGRWILSGSRDNTVRIWNMDKKYQEAVLRGHEHVVTALCISVDSTWVISGSRDNTVRIWNIHSKAQEAVLRGHEYAVRSVCITLDGRWIISGSDDTTVRIWNMHTKSQEAVLYGHEDYVWCVCVSMDSKWILSGSDDETIRIWSMDRKSEEAVLRGHESAVNSVCMSVNSRLIISGGGNLFEGGDTSLKIWS
jgi:WD40 repeat protein